jgi:hypothetical protein
LFEALLLTFLDGFFELLSLVVDDLDVDISLLIVFLGFFFFKLMVVKLTGC